jgi:surface protein
MCFPRTITLLTLLFLSAPVFAQEQEITIGADGIVRCKDVPIGTTKTIGFDTYEVVDRELLIQRRDEEADMSQMCVSNVTDMTDLFNRKRNFNTDIGSWDVSNVTDMSGMFFVATSFNRDISKWQVSNVTSMRYMFGTASSFNADISLWDVSNVVNMSGLFSSARSFNQDIGGWDVSSATTMFGMFTDAEAFNHSLDSWDVSNVVYMGSMFQETKLFDGNIGSWNVSSVVSTKNMFNGALSFNQGISNWDVYNVTDLSGMFNGALSFNQDISSWCVSNIASEPSNFRGGNTPLLLALSPIWGTCPGVPGQIDLAAPSMSDEIDFNTAIFSWNPDSFATKYIFQIVTAAGASVVDTETTEPSYSPTSAIPSQTAYFWRVVAVNENRMVGGTVATGDWSDVRQFTVVNYTPTASPTASVLEGPAPLDVAFDASGSSDPNGDALTYTWDFKDGSAAMGATPTHSFAAGTYEVALTVSDGELASTDTITITAINTAPVANIVASVTEGLAPLEVSFDASGSSDANGDALTYAWDFKDGTTSTDVSPTHTFKAGTYDVTLIVSDGVLADTATVAITATNSAPVASASASTTQGQAPFSIDFNASASTDPNNDALTFAWDFGDGATGSGETVSHTYTAAGEYTVVLTASDGHLTGTDSLTVSIASGVDTESFELPESFVLRAAYPNPFNPTTTITYGLPAAAEVRITATDLLGRQVATLVAGDMKEAGYHTAQFNAEGLASGTYLIRMEAGDFVATQQVVLLK